MEEKMTKEKFIKYIESIDYDYVIITDRVIDPYGESRKLLMQCKFILNKKEQIK